MNCNMPLDYISMTSIHHSGLIKFPFTITKSVRFKLLSFNWTLLKCKPHTVEREYQFEFYNYNIWAKLNLLYVFDMDGLFFLNNNCFFRYFYFFKNDLAIEVGYNANDISLHLSWF